MMTSLKTWCLLPLAVLLLLLSIAPTVTEVVQSLSQCDGFLLQGPPKHIPCILNNGKIVDQNRYKPICQTYENERTFVTLYDTKNKIPVFSAYKYRDSTQIKKRSVMQHDTENKKAPKQTSLMIKPQHEGNDMMNEEHSQFHKHYYEIDGYKKGYLFPPSHAFDECAKNSTLTPTNIVPQAKQFKDGSWHKMESCVKCVMDKYCIKNNGVTEGYVVAGAVTRKKKTNQRVNIPSVLWSAFCCYSKDKWLASAHWGANTAEDFTSEYLQTKTLEELYQELDIEVFPRTLCPFNATVAEFYSEINGDESCQCPTQAPPQATRQKRFLKFLYNSRMARYCRAKY